MSADPWELLKEAREYCLVDLGAGDLIERIDAALAAQAQEPMQPPIELTEDQRRIARNRWANKDFAAPAQESAEKPAEPIAFVSGTALAALKNKSILGPIPVYTEPFGENTIPLCSHAAPRDMIPREMRDILIRHARREALRQAAESAEHDYALYTAVDFATELRRMADEVS